MYVCMYVCMYVYVCVCMRMYVYVCVCMCMYVYVCVCMCMYVCMYVCMYLSLCILGTCRTHFDHSNFHVCFSSLRWPFPFDSVTAEEPLGGMSHTEALMLLGIHSLVSLQDGQPHLPRIQQLRAFASSPSQPPTVHPLLTRLTGQHMSK